MPQDTYFDAVFIFLNLCANVAIKQKYAARYHTRLDSIICRVKMTDGLLKPQYFCLT